MTLEFTCQKCESSFEIEAADLIDGSEKIVCPHCDAKAPTTLADDFTSALHELRAQVATLGKKFAVSFQVDSEEVEELEEEDEEEDDEDERDEDDEDELDFEESEDDDEDFEEEEP
jgi:DNA-directed RNA polymerase subunit RPC12/RpoP